jgi:hypothetical protein
VGYSTVGIDEGWEGCGMGVTVQGRKTQHYANGTPVCKSRQGGPEEGETCVGLVGVQEICQGGWCVGSQPAILVQLYVGAYVDRTQCSTRTARIDRQSCIRCMRSSHAPRTRNPEPRRAYAKTVKLLL